MSSSCLVECGSQQHLVEEERGELRPALGSSAGCPSPSPRTSGARPRSARRPRRGTGAGACRRRATARSRPPPDPVGVQRRDQHRLPRADADAHQHGAVHAGRVHHRHRVGDEVQVAVLRRVGGPVGPAVAPRVDGDDAVVLGEVGHLALPRAALHARVDRHEHHGRSTVARGRVVEGLVADPQAVAVDVRPGRRVPELACPPPSLRRIAVLAAVATDLQAPARNVCLHQHPPGMHHHGRP